MSDLAAAAAARPLEATHSEEEIKDSGPPSEEVRRAQRERMEEYDAFMAQKIVDQETKQWVERLRAAGIADDDAAVRFMAFETLRDAEAKALRFDPLAAEAARVPPSSRSLPAFDLFDPTAWNTSFPFVKQRWLGAGGPTDALADLGDIQSFLKEEVLRALAYAPPVMQPHLRAYVERNTDAMHNAVDHCGRLAQYLVLNPGTWNRDLLIAFLRQIIVGETVHYGLREGALAYQGRMGLSLLPLLPAGLTPQPIDTHLDSCDARAFWGHGPTEDAAPNKLDFDGTRKEGLSVVSFHFSGTDANFKPLYAYLTLRVERFERWVRRRWYATLLAFLVEHKRRIDPAYVRDFMRNGLEEAYLAPTLALLMGADSPERRNLAAVLMEVGADCFLDGEKDTHACRFSVH